MVPPGWIFSVLASSLLALDSNTINSPPSSSATITGLYRYAVKGLSGDSLKQVHISQAYDTFPDDRRFALLYDKNVPKWQDMLSAKKEWLHKENFLCAFTNPELMARYEASYQLLLQQSSSSSKAESYGVPSDNIVGKEHTAATRRLLSLRDRTSQASVFGPEDLATEHGQTALADFFSQQSGLAVQCITADGHARQKHQFGNTSSRWKQQRKDTRTIHLINANTVQQVAEKCQIPTLHPTRFRPNIVVEGWEPWAEFDWIGKTLKVHSSSSSSNKNTKEDPIRLSVLAKTVRCDGVSVDPLDPGVVLDVPKLLTQHFPEHGPYLGIYATIDDPGVLSLGDQVMLSLDE
ncbi:MOSC domain-containing protein [Seminavis robusta]|uniref:MOSC domain-containing protein n=1 Tax=Seminavis robusta TaxID=568900 RepID=A0A9N8H641_9STRA|nr:MOSC domain-containing protein [Seminavis robusta]|eukprot:Sro134_g063310.1 MOSC domain-containing protein (349) ;mRNA; f:11548-12594